MYILDICGPILDLDIGYIIYILYIYNFDNNVIHLIIILLLLFSMTRFCARRAHSAAARRVSSRLSDATR